ncbi:tryptophan--tRNA ligase [Gammaproteobacteria bacterium]|nr:tryptophan--tRNA ligase [Gammaproteobacteria bacterium]|tara:strand:+ start:3635 stop:4627 length:993 start_codon:yes stop_codon:yes gene_type:complete
MKKRILTGITTTGTPHIGNYLGAIKPSLNLAKESIESFFFLADYHALIKTNDSQSIKASVNDVALAWLSSGLDTKSSFFYRQSDIKEITELNWILTCVTAKGLMNRAHAYKSASAENKTDEDKGINMGLFSYPILMATDILIFNSTHVPVGPDQLQHLEMTRDIANRFNHLYKKIFNVPEAIIQDDGKVVTGLDGRKMSKSYNNIIPLLSDEKTLKKSIAKIVTNSLEPGEPKDIDGCNVFNLYSHFSSTSEQNDFASEYADGISWGDAKNKLFESINKELSPIRETYNKLSQDKGLVNDLLDTGASKVRPLAAEMLGEIRELVGISKID